MKLYYLYLILTLWAFNFLSGQKTDTKISTKIFSEPNVETSIGELNANVSLQKFKLDKSGKFVKASFDFYIPVEALVDARVSLPIGTQQMADNTKFQLLSAKLNNKQVRIRIKITNLNSKKSYDFSAMTLIKMVAQETHKGELNPFEGKYQDFAIIKPKGFIVADLVYDFKKDPREVELICSGKMGGEKVFYSLGF